MNIAIVIPESWEPTQLVLWAAAIARDKGANLLLIRPRRVANSRTGKKSQLRLLNSPLQMAIRAHASDFIVIDRDDPAVDRQQSMQNVRKPNAEQRYLILKQVESSNLIPAVLKEIKALRVGQLIVPRQLGVRIHEEGFAVERQLIQEMPCETLQLRPGKSIAGDCHSILVAVGSSQRKCRAMNLGAELTANQEKKLTAVYVEQHGVPLPKPIADKSVKRLVSKSLRPRVADVTPELVIDEDVPRGVKSYATGKGHDLVIVGAGRHLAEDRQLPTSVPEKLMAEMDEPTVVVVRKAMPLTGRLLKSVERRKKSLVPQLGREARVDLVQRLQASAKWDFDFVFLIFLSTLLASLGLALDSPPVVIGAMLVAPLMIPMLGLGMSVVQGNRRMADGCLRTIGHGFLVAFATGFFVGVGRILFTSGITDEMSSRGMPGVLDLAAAFVSGVVATYALGRPHLLSVLPGIAIATSLMPPIATAGMSLAAWHLDVAMGATLLFLSNFLAIVLGSAFTLWIVGMRGPREICPFSLWGRRWMVGCAAASLCLGLFFITKSDTTQLLAAPVSNDTELLAAPVAVSDELTDPPPVEKTVDPPAPAHHANLVEAPMPPATADKTRRIVSKPALPPNRVEAPMPPATADKTIRIVLKPAAPPNNQSSGAEITVTLPDRLFPLTRFGLEPNTHNSASARNGTFSRWRRHRFRPPIEQQPTEATIDRESTPRDTN